MTPRGDISLRLDGGIATLQVHNPARRNAIDGGMWDKLASLSTELAGRSDLRVVVVRGEGQLAFSAGADISAFDGARSGTGARDYDDLVEAACRAVEAIPCPTLALMMGVCAGGGASLAAACDLRVAANDAFFMVPAARLGLGYDRREVARLARAYGFAATRQLLYLGDRLDAVRAYQLGAVHALAPLDKVEDLAETYTRRIAANAPLTIAGAKTAIRALTENDDRLWAEAERLTAVADGSADYAEGRRAFAEKRAPQFRGN